MTMCARPKKLAVMLTITAILLSFTQANMKMVSSSDTARKIDVFTQKEPYSGKGPNIPSDAFASQEEVVLYANVTYGDYPVNGKNVAFEVRDPMSRPVVMRTAVTNENGVANVSFRIPGPNDYGVEAIFGVWNVIATVDIAGVTVNDTLSFLVGWIIELIKVEAVDANNVSRTSFMRDEHMCFRLTVKNIANTSKIATLIFNVFDNLSVSLGQIILLEEIKPGVTVLFIEDLLIPKWASLGVGVVYANAYTALPALGGVPWCRQVFTTFLIVEKIVPVPPIHDVAVSKIVPFLGVVPFPTFVYIGEILTIYVVVENEGNQIESFNVTTFYENVTASNVVGTIPVNRLQPGEEKLLVFNWNTRNVTEGNYTLSAEASAVPGEINIENNKFVDDVVWIKLWTFPPVWGIPMWLLALLFGLALLIGICLISALLYVLWRRRRKRKRQRSTQLKMPREVEFKKTKTCGACGKQFNGVHTFCPYCFTFHGKDYQ